MTPHTLTQKEYSNLKRRLTLAKNRLAKATTVEDKTAAAEKLVAECLHADRIFADKGTPDAWCRWTRAREDASRLLARFE